MGKIWSFCNMKFLWNWLFHIKYTLLNLLYRYVVSHYTSCNSAYTSLCQLIISNWQTTLYVFEHENLTGVSQICWSQISSDLHNSNLASELLSTTWRKPVNKLSYVMAICKMAEDGWKIALCGNILWINFMVWSNKTSWSLNYKCFEKSNKCLVLPMFFIISKITIKFWFNVPTLIKDKENI